MRKTRKVATLASTIVMVAGGMASVYAAGATGETNAKASKDARSAGDTNMFLTGIIEVTTLSVTTLTTMSFNVNMTKIPDSEAGGDATKAVNVQVERPDGTICKITNNSASLVWVYVIGATPEANGGSLPVLANTYASVKTKDNNMLFAIKDPAESPPEAGAYDGTTKPEPDEIGAPGYWMTTAISSTGKHYPNSTAKGKLITKDLAVDTKIDKNEMPLAVYASTGKG